MSLAGLALAVATQVWAGLSRSLTTTTMVVLCRELYIIIYLVKMASTLWHCRWRTRPTKDPVVRSIQLLRELTGVNQTNRVSPSRATESERKETWGFSSAEIIKAYEGQGSWGVGNFYI